MKIFVSLVICLAVTAMGAELRPREFRSFISDNVDHRPVVVMMHVAWCGACQRTLPHFIEAEKNLNSSAAMGHIDLTDESEFVEEMKLKGYPALRVLPRGSDPATPFSAWTSVPYYSRDSLAMTNFIERINGPDFFVQEVGDSKILETPRFGHQVTLLVSGEREGLVDSIKDLKTRFQIITGSLADSMCPLSTVDSTCLAVVPSDESVLLKRVAKKTFSTTDSSSGLLAWINAHAFPGLWNIKDGKFQLFNDQPNFKVLIAPITDVGSEVNACIDRLEGKVSFGVINGTAMKDVLEEFGITELPAVLMLGDGRLDYDKYFNDIRISALCEDVDAALAGQKELKFRGGLGAKIRYTWKRFLIFFGLESDFSKAIALLSSVLTVTVLTAWGISSCFDSPDNDEADNDKKKKKTE